MTADAAPAPPPLPAVPLPAPLTPLEVAAGQPMGAPGDAPLTVLPRRAETSPVAALEAAVRPGLERGPCIVSFSGGRDSSGVLALAVRLARREGLPLPVPVTLRFPDAPASHESSWQERVVRHVGVDEWVRIDLADDLDLVGPRAAAILERHGLLWPPNTHFHDPILEQARGGTILTGIDGDGLFARWRWLKAALVVSGRRLPHARELRNLALAASPRWARLTIDRRRPVPPLPWLRAQANRERAELLARELRDEPVPWHRWVAWFAAQRSLRLVLASFATIAADHDVQAVHPFADPAFLGALARTGGWTGLGDRSAIMRALCGEVLPADVLERVSKARMDGAFWHRHARAFVGRWDGTGVDTALVDGEWLRREWAQPVPHAGSSTLLQAAWLAARRSQQEIR